MAGQSGTSLPKKLGLKPGQRLALIREPNAFLEALEPLPEGTRVVTRGEFDLGVAFVRTAEELRTTLPPARRRLDPAGALWIAWPKRASGIETDVTEDIVRAHALASGLVDVKVIAVDDTWSALKLVVRLSDRPSGKRRRPTAGQLDVGGEMAEAKSTRRPRSAIPRPPEPRVPRFVR